MTDDITLDEMIAHMRLWSNWLSSGRNVALEQCDAQVIAAALAQLEASKQARELLDEGFHGADPEWEDYYDQQHVNMAHRILSAGPMAGGAEEEGS